MSDLGTLSHCMTDSDPEAAKRARRLRRKALVASLFFETLLIAAMLVLPLITPGVLPKNYIIIPLPPLSGLKNPSPPHSHANPPAPHNTHSIPKNTIWFQPPRIPAHVDASADNTPPAIDEPTGNGNPDIPGAPGFGPGMTEGGGRPMVVPPPPAKPPRKISIGVMEASLINRVDPVYPALALATRTSGEVRLRATIGTDGVIKDYEVVTGNPLLVRAAIAAIRQWRYRPTQLNGEAVEVETLITVNFILQ
jgi:periplasmic protein TonB